MKVDWVKVLSTFFGIGYLPYCPGTWASLLGVCVYLLLRNFSIIYLGLTFAILITGFLVCGEAEKRFKEKDASFIVIDEIAAMLILLIFVPKSLFFLIIAFLIFRFIDILKPYPIKKIENFSGSWGIMIDDLVATFYTAAIVLLVSVFVGDKI